MSNFIDFLLVISKLQSPIYRRSPQTYKILGGGRTFDGLHRRLAPLGQIPSFSLSFDKSELS